MTEHKKLSLTAAIFISINIMLGTGFFINTVVLTNMAGSLSSFVYIFVALLMLPLIMSVAKLLEYSHESGTFYDFGRHVSPFFGFISSWSYFVAKMCAAALGIHVCLSFLQLIIPLLQSVPILTLDVIAIMIFTGLNLLNMQFGKHIQLSFICMKIVPVLFVILSGLYLFNGAFFTPESVKWQGVPLTIPLILYVFTGFEASCSLSSQIVNPKVNGPRAIYISYGIAVSIVFLYQFFFYGSLGMYLGNLTGGYLAMFPALLRQLTPETLELKKSIITLFNIAVASSSLGAAYGIMYSNSWNLYTLAKNNHTFGQQMFSSLNKHGVPAACILVEGLLAITYLLITQGNQIPLQQVSSLGATITYTFSVISLLFLAYKKNLSLHIPLLGIISCTLLLSSFVWSITVQGPTAMLMVFFGLLIFGSYMFYRMHEPKEPLEIYEDI